MAHMIWAISYVLYLIWGVWYGSCCMGHTETRTLQSPLINPILFSFMGKRFRHDATNFFRQYFCGDSIISQGNSIITRYVLKMELFYTSYSELLRWEKYRVHLLWDRWDLAAEIDFQVQKRLNPTVNLTL